jgi:hypothetical protein
VAWGRDPKSYKTVPVAMIQAPARPAPGASLYTAFCGCGYTRPLPAAEKNSTPRCPGCGKLMTIENAPPQARNKNQSRTKPSAPLLPLHLRAPLKTQVKKGTQFFDCVCGERILIRAGSEGRPIQCPACDRHHLLKVDVPQQQPGSSPAPAPAAKPQGAAPVPPPATRPLSLGEFLCQCGEIQPPRTSRTGRDFVCRKCGRKGHVETGKDPETGLPKMRPIFTSGPTHAPAPADKPEQNKVAAKAPEGVVSFEELEPVEAPFAAGGTFETAAGSATGDAPPAVDADAQIVPCECGAEILLAASDVGHTIQCPACADTMVVEGNTDSRTGATNITLRIVGALDDPDWKLEEFQ